MILRQIPSEYEENFVSFYISVLTWGLGKGRVGALGHTLFTQHSFRATRGGLNTWTTQNIVTNIERRLVNYESHVLEDN